MTTIYVTCPWCYKHVYVTPDDVTLTVRNDRSLDGIYRWFHCGQLITRRANSRIFSVLLGAGCEVEYTDDAEVLAFSYDMAEVKTPADMGFVS